MGFVKVCGINDSRAMEAALAAGVDAVGFVFARSVRQVTPRQAQELARAARGRALCVAVTLHPSSELLEEILEVLRPDVLQTDRKDLARIELPPGVAAWPVLRAEPMAHEVALRADQRVLFEGPRSGAGRVADWKSAQALARCCELILAGGLSAANVGAAVDAVRPFGVDVSSGVEESPGRKNPELIRQFVTRARAAFAHVAAGEPA